MDNLLNIDNMEMIKTLGFLHDNIKVITHNIVTYKENGKVYIVDLNDNPIVISDTDKIILTGTFAVVCDTHIASYMNEEPVRVINFLTMTQIETTITGSSDIYGFGSEFLMMPKKSGDYFSSTKVIYNKYFEALYEFGRFGINSRTSVIKEDPIKVVVNYFWDGIWKTMILNKESAQIELFDSVVLDEKQDVILFGTEWSKKDSLTVNRAVLNNVKYKLCVKGKILSDAYQDITKPQELVNSPFYMTHDICHESFGVVKGKCSRPCKGIINEVGQEIIQPIYDDIRYIGSNIFLLTFYSIVRVYSIDRGILFDNIPTSSVWIHPTLPLTVIMLDTDCYAVDSYGRVFSIVELPKYFECYATSDDPDVLKVVTPYKNIYISRKLVPITNIHNISKLMTYNWVRI